MKSAENMNSIEAMVNMLQHKRPDRSKMERKFLQRFITSLGGVAYDKIGNRIKRIGDAPFMFSCHTDSVHRSGGYQDIASKGHTLKLHSKSPSNCLGADNAAGAWIMREMILANKPGLYVFHRGEEVGCVGSKFITKHTPELVKDIKAAIAFDRRGTKSIITHQWCGRTCSDAFAESLGKELKLGHKPDSGGSVTDTAQYVDLVPECTNVSVGFQNEHCSSETLDMDYLIELRQAMLELNYDNLTISRKPGTHEPKTYHYYNYKPHDDYYEGYRYDRKEGWGYHDRGEVRQLTYTPPKKQLGFIDHDSDFLPDGHDSPLMKEQRKKTIDRMYMVKMIKDNPYAIATLLDEFGQSADDVADWLFANGKGNSIPPEMYSHRKEE